MLQLSSTMYNFTKLQTTYVASAVTATVLVVGAYFLTNKKKDRVPEHWKEVGTLEKLYLYPLKSGRRVELETAECTDVGIRESQKFDKSFRLRDRCLVIYSPKDNEFKTARTYPKLLHIEVETTDMNYITVNAPNMRTLFVKIPNKQENEEKDIVQFRGELIKAIDCGDEAAQWVSQYLLEKEEGMRLAYNDTTIKRDVVKKYKDFANYYKNFGNDATGLHSDVGSMHLINQSSVDDLNQRLDKGQQVTADNFRPNFLIRGQLLKPYEEDKWDWIKIGDVVVRNIMECTRCMMTTIDQDKAERNKTMEPLKTLKTYRIGQGPSKDPVMGAYLKLYKGGEIKVGDKVYLGTDI